MKTAPRVLLLCLTSCLAAGTMPATTILSAQTAAPPQTQPQTQAPTGDFKPVFGQAGKDVVWVPSPPEMVEKMLDMAKVTSNDFVMDLGSGDGRNIIAAARRGARGVGVEFNPEMVALSRRNAAQEGVTETAQFVEGDMFEADVSRATVLALFLLTDNLRRLRPKFLDLRPGTRIVVNTFSIPDWEPDERETATGDCTSWCTILLWIVPAKVAGTWRLPDGELTLQQQYQVVTGTFSSNGASTPIAEGRLRGDEIAFSVNGARYHGKVNGQTMDGQAEPAAGGGGTPWKATRAAQ